MGNNNLAQTHIELGISITTGNMIADNIGAEQRMDYTVICAPVRLASRLEKLNKKYHTNSLIAERTQEKVHGWVETKQIANISIKGLTKKENVDTV